jgi:hypothetical protein
MQAGAELHRRHTFGIKAFSVQAARFSHVPVVPKLVLPGECPTASNAVWWAYYDELIVKAVEGDEEAVTALVASLRGAG